jgi:hypothetical protein
VTTPDVKLKSFTNSALYSGKTEMRMGLKNNYLIGSGGETQTLNIRTLTPLILPRSPVSRVLFISRWGRIADIPASYGLQLLV